MCLESSPLEIIALCSFGKVPRDFDLSSHDVKSKAACSLHGQVGKHSIVYTMIFNDNAIKFTLIKGVYKSIALYTIQICSRSMAI